ncbi:MAG: hypothetical protein AUF79_02410 [Crenarchaeota archaeon 13_1_20CM_2_51_8]|nr:MAG: hypothetical protein AUF79_02410 [Crenarchaeota archaeon 13_1_20CM_2_51_8]
MLILTMEKAPRSKLPTWLNKMFKAYALKRVDLTASADTVKGKNSTKKKAPPKKARRASSQDRTTQ